MSYYEQYIIANGLFTSLLSQQTVASLLEIRQFVNFINIQISEGDFFLKCKPIVDRYWL